MKAAITSVTTCKQLKQEYPLSWAELIDKLPSPQEEMTLKEYFALYGEDEWAWLYRLNHASDLLPQFLPSLPLEERIRLTRQTWEEKPHTIQQMAQMDHMWHAVADKQRATCDVRPMLAEGIDPFAMIRDRAMQLAPKELLRLLVPFEPLPLYVAMRRLGFEHMSRFTGECWEIFFFRPDDHEMTQPTVPPPPDMALAAWHTEKEMTLDVRGLPPPEPMVRVLTAVTRLKKGETLRVIHERIPTLLYPRLAERGLVVETEEEKGVIYLHIRYP